jgi:hypothetical protein
VEPKPGSQRRRRSGRFITDTAFHADKDDAARAKASATIPMGRFGVRGEIAPSCWLLFPPQRIRVVIVTKTASG